MTTLTLRVSEGTDVLAMFTIGDQVAWRQADGSSHPEFNGAVVDGEVKLTPGGRTRVVRYWVKREDGRIFGARELDLVLAEARVRAVAGDD